MADLRISDLVTASQLKNDDYYEISQSESGTRVSYKATLLAIAVQIATMVDFTSDLNTTSKKITGAINELKQLISLIPQFSIEVVEELPTEDISDTTIYLVPAEDPEVGNYYEEYIYVNNTWELVGTTAVDLSAYYTKLEVDGLLADKLEADDFEASQTASANPITLETKQAGLAKSCVVSFGPIQDLHGQSAPYPAGGGKNKAPLTLTKFKQNNTQGTWNNNVYTYRSVTLTISTTSDDYIKEVSFSGTISQISTFVADSFDLPAGTYKINGATLGARLGTRMSLQTMPDQTEIARIYTGQPDVEFTLSQNSTVRLILVISDDLSSGAFYPMIRLSTVTDATFAPYSNICPISGRTEASVTRTAGEDAETHTKEFGQTVIGGKYDAVSGKLSITDILLEPSAVNSVAYGSGLYYCTFGLSSATKNPLTENGLKSSHFKPTNQVFGIGNCYITANGTLLVFVLPDQTITTKALADDWITANKPQFSYKPTTEVEIQLSPEALTLLKGLNVISTDGDKVQVEFSDIPVGDYSAILDYIKSLEARIKALEG